MHTVKEQVLHAVQRLPDDADFRDINVEIAMLAAIADAEEDVQEGPIIESWEMRARLEEWLDG